MIITFTIIILPIKPMRVKTKTAALILQKQAEKQKSNPQSSKSIKPQPLKLSTQKQLSIRTLGHYDVFSLTFRTGKQRQEDVDKRSEGSSHQSEYCLLEKQNYRLIQANFNILVKFGTVVDMVKDQLIKVIQFIEQYQYVFAVETIYATLDMLTKIDGLNAKQASESIKYFDRQFLRKNTSLKQSIFEKQSELKQVHPLNNSVVEQYKVTQFKQNKNPQRNRFKICLGVSSITYTPPKINNNLDNFMLEDLKTPYFTQQSYSNNYGSVQQNMRHSFESGMNSRVQSAMGIRRREDLINLSGQVEEKNSYEVQFINQSQYNRPTYSQKNITVFRTNAKKQVQQQNRLQSVYRMLFVQANSMEYILTNS